MGIFAYIKRLFLKKPHIKTEQQLNRMSKNSLEIYARTLGLEIDKRYNKDTLVKQILAEQRYYE
jgi:hypothetical protein